MRCEPRGSHQPAPTHVKNLPDIRTVIMVAHWTFEQFQAGAFKATIRNKPIIAKLITLLIKPDCQIVNSFTEKWRC
ncbi:hypothetical protein A1355_02715 [Methylomonas koyamae]|uniref:Uncharacterized protein n=1 Tax=Methylomonas koyamae TaxID=702114 RepID=A0A177NTM4_9GAMM|nr:hypothetical protein A1355_02715 [Methylomonas koyamae]